MGRMLEGITAMNAGTHLLGGRRWEDQVIAFEDMELNEWLIQAIEEGAGQFLPALAEAVVKACPEDYSLVRPALMNLKRRYCFVNSTTTETGHPIATKKVGSPDFRSRGEFVKTRCE